MKIKLYIVQASYACHKMVEKYGTGTIEDGADCAGLGHGRSLGQGHPGRARLRGLALGEWVNSLQMLPITT